MALQYELHGAHDASSRFLARWTAVHDNVKGTEGHLAQAAQELTVAQTKLVHEKSRSRACKAEWLAEQDAVTDPSLLSASMCQFVDAPLRKRAGDLIMDILGHVSSKMVSVLCKHIQAL